MKAGTEKEEVGGCIWSSVRPLENPQCSTGENPKHTIVSTILRVHSCYIGHPDYRRLPISGLNDTRLLCGPLLATIEFYFWTKMDNNKITHLDLPQTQTKNSQTPANFSYN